jgi:hypothetical protein
MPSKVVVPGEKDTILSGTGWPACISAVRPRQNQTDISKEQQEYEKQNFADDRACIAAGCQRFHNGSGLGGRQSCSTLLSQTMW